MERKMQAVKTLAVEELISALEPVIRRIIKEELLSVMRRQDCVLQLDPDSDLYKDMLELQERNRSGQLAFMSHKEVWGE
jgi:hypothetical protein